MEWNQTPECLLTQSIHAAHARTRERFSALYQVATGRSPVAVAQELGRRHDTVTGWINRYNRQGPDSMTYRRTGGRPPFVRSSKRQFPASSTMPLSEQPQLNVPTILSDGR